MKKQEVKETLQRVFKENRLPLMMGFSQLTQLHRSWVKNPKRWGWPEGFGKQVNTDFKSVAITLNRIRFGKPIDPRSIGAPSGTYVELAIAIQFDGFNPLNMIAKQCVREDFPLSRAEMQEFLAHVLKQMAGNNASRKVMPKRLERQRGRRRMIDMSIFDKGLPVKKRSPYVTLGYLLGMLEYYNIRPWYWQVKHAKVGIYLPQVNRWSRTMMDWLIEKKNHPLLRAEVEKRYGVVAGEPYPQVIRLITVLDELEPEWLTQGKRTAVADIIDKIYQKRIAALQKELGAAMQPYPQHWSVEFALRSEAFQTMAEHVKVLGCQQELQKEGIAMQHCIATYHNRIRDARGHLLIVHISKHGGSTALLELRDPLMGGWIIVSHRAHNNYSPSDENITLAGEFGKLLNRTYVVGNDTGSTLGKAMDKTFLEMHRAI